MKSTYRYQIAGLSLILALVGLPASAAKPVKSVKPSSTLTTTTTTTPTTTDTTTTTPTTTTPTTTTTTTTDTSSGTTTTPSAAPSSTLVNPNATAEAREVMAYLASIYGKKSIFAYNVYAQTPDIYQQTGKNGAIYARDFMWPGDMKFSAQDAKDNRYILAYHWHWYFNGESAWAGQRANPVNVGAMITPGTQENLQAIAEMSAVADNMQILRDAGVPVLFRPLHEIDGGWFWWTDKVNPGNTAALYRMIYDYFTKTRGLNNIIWVYNAATGLSVDQIYRSKFYPGADYVDIASIDVYGVDYRNAITDYKTYFNIMSQIAPGKMLSLAEADACPDPDKIASGIVPAWLYCMPWWGTPDKNHPLDWTLRETNSDSYITLEELPYLGSGSIKPAVGIISPLDDGGAYFNDNKPVIQAYAVARGSAISRVDFLADGVLIGSVASAPYTFTWNAPNPGLYSIQAKAVAIDGSSSLSNIVRIATGVADLAFNQPTSNSKSDSSATAVDGNFYTSWVSNNDDDEWIYVDFGKPYDVNTVQTIWGWKISPYTYSIDVALQNPDDPVSWTTVKSSVAPSDWSNWMWKVTLKDSFPTVSARYLRYHMTKRNYGQGWAGYDLRALRIPVANNVNERAINTPPEISMPAFSTPSEIFERTAVLEVAATDADHDVPIYSWSVISGPADGVTFGSNSQVTSNKVSVVFNKGGDYTLRATVSDGRGGTATSDVHVVAHDIVGSLLTDDRSGQSSTGLGEYEAMSMWNAFATRFVLQRGNVTKAILRVYRKSTDTVPVIISARSGLSDQWSEAIGPIPAAGDLVGTASSSGGGQWIDIDVTKYIAAEALGDGVATIILTSDQGSWNTNIHSHQNSVNPPQLILSF